MSATRPIVDALSAHIQAALPQVLVEVFPERPSEYSFMHPNGVVLVGYQGSRFTQIESLSPIAQQRDITLDLTVIGTGWHGDEGALALLDEVRLAVVGYAPPNCQPCHLGEERFLAEDAGAWLYRLSVHTETQQVQQTAASDLPKFVQAHYRRQDAPLNPDLTPKQGD